MNQSHVYFKERKLHVQWMAILAMDFQLPIIMILQHLITMQYILLQSMQSRQLSKIDSISLIIKFT